MQFNLLGTVFYSVACAGMGIFAVAKPMMSEVFSSSLPTVVTAAFASQYVQLLSAGNLGGRIGWAGESCITNCAQFWQSNGVLNTWCAYVTCI
jgi:hypothetical protein